MSELLASVHRQARALYREAATMDVLDAAPRLTLLLLILYGGSYWYLVIPMTIICALGFLYRSLYRSGPFWFVLSAVLAWGNFLNWYAVDNHKYLMLYWCIAIYFALRASDPREVLADNARLLIGLAFGFATVWKLISGDFLSADFFHYTLLADSRFAGVARLFGGVSAEQLTINGLAIGELLRFDSSLAGVPLVDGARTRGVAVGLTWWTLAAEALIAAAFLAPSDPVRKWGNWMLQGFALCTYSVANVVGFGWLLMILGFAQCSPRMPRTRTAYVGVFFLVQVYRVPWWDVVARIVT